METLKLVVFLLLLADSLVANAIAWAGREWYVKNFRTFSRYLPITKAWALWYLVLVLWIGFVTYY